MYTMFLKRFFTILLLFTFVSNSIAQHEKSEWVIGTSLAFAKFTDFLGYYFRRVYCAAIS